jgi:hypothetical protein
MIMRTRATPRGDSGHVLDAEDVALRLSACFNKMTAIPTVRRPVTRQLGRISHALVLVELLSTSS